MAWVERLDRRSAKARVFDDSENPRRHRAEIGVDDLHYHDGSAWQVVNEALEADGLDGFSHKAGRMRHLFRTAAAGGGRRWYPRRNVLTEYVEFGAPQYWTGTAWSTLTLGTPTVSGNKILWDRPLYALQVTVTWRHIKVEVTLKTSQAARRIRWPVSLTGLTRDGWTLMSGTRAVGTIQKPWAQDANGTTMPVVASIASGYVEFTADLTGAVYPVVIDPTLTQQPDSAGMATFVRSDSADNSYGGLAYLEGIPGPRWLLKFDLSSIPSGSTIDSGTLSFWIQAAMSWGSTITLTAYRILAANSSWTDAAEVSGTGATWNYPNQGATGVRWAGDSGSDGGADAGCSVSGTDYDGTAMGTATVTTANGVGAERQFTLNTTELTEMVAANHGFVISLSGGGGDYFNADSDDGDTAGERPKIVIDYTEGGAPVLGASQGPDHVALTWS